MLSSLIHSFFHLLALFPQMSPGSIGQVFAYSGKDDPVEALILTEDQARKDQILTTNYDLKVIVSAYFYSKIE